MMKRSNAFTLIELLVVIAIIAILAAILFPVFAQAREKARQSNCTSNCKQIGTAFMQYRQDYSETMPAQRLQTAMMLTTASGWTAPTADCMPLPNSAITAFDSRLATTQTNDQFNWARMTQPYIKNTGIFNCPSASGGTSDVTKISYAYNGLLNRNWNSTGAHATPLVTTQTAEQPVVDAAVSRVSEIVMVMDIGVVQTGSPLIPYHMNGVVGSPAVLGTQVGYGTTNAVKYLGIYETTSGTTRTIIGNHSGRSKVNMCYYDGHAETQDVNVNLSAAWASGTTGTLVFHKYFDPTVNSN